MCDCSLLPEAYEPIAQPLGEQEGDLNPPLPVGMPCGRIPQAESIFFTLSDSHFGHFGGFLSEANTNSSN